MPPENWDTLAHRHWLTNKQTHVHNFTCLNLLKIKTLLHGMFYNQELTYLKQWIAFLCQECILGLLVRGLNSCPNIIHISFEMLGPIYIIAYLCLLLSISLHFISLLVLDDISCIMMLTFNWAVSFSLIMRLCVPSAVFPCVITATFFLKHFKNF